MYSFFKVCSQHVNININTVFMSSVANLSTCKLQLQLHNLLKNLFIALTKTHILSRTNITNKATFFLEQI